MSDSELSDAASALPSDGQIESCLKRVTRKGISGGEFTVKKAREAAEQELGLDAGFFKLHETWKVRSKEIIELVAEEDQLSPEKPKPAKTAVKPAAKVGSKRKSDGAAIQKAQPRKKTRKNEPEDDLHEEESDAEATPSDDDDLSDATPVKKAPAKRKSASKKSANLSDDEEKGAKEKKKATMQRKAPAKKAAERVVDDSEASDDGARDRSPPIQDTEKSSGDTKEGCKDESERSEVQKDTKTAVNERPSAPEDDDSDMSVLIDEPPKKKRGEKIVAEPKDKTKGTTAKATTTKKKAAAEASTPDQEEIKRLQGWLVKCGIRKLWHRELADCNTDKAKIKHLKGMLEEAGMSGRYSNEKAKDIKERRELAAELEATQEYAKKWGQDKDAEDGDESDGDEQISEEELKPATRKPKGLVDFGDSGDDGSD